MELKKQRRENKFLTPEKVLKRSIQVGVNRRIEEKR